MTEILDTIVGAANVEQNQELNGNVKLNQGKPVNKFYEGTIIEPGTGEKIEVSASSPVSPYAYKYFLRLDDKPVTWADIESLNPVLRSTKGLYMIKYTPRNSKDRKKGRPWKIGQDLIRWDIRVSGKKHWNYLCDKIPELDWLRRNSTLTDRMFDLAVMHPGMSFWFSVDWVRYEAKLQAQSESVLEKPFVSRKASVEEYKKVAKHNNKGLLCRYFSDVLKEVNEAEKQPAVQEEMIAAEGEVYNRSRKCPRDPVTGQFIKKEKD